MQFGMLGAPVLDWKAYHEHFVEEHGDPVLWQEGRWLLFQDGYTCSANYAGPENLPPVDVEELRLLKLDYWRQRRRVVAAERDLLRHRVERRKTLQSVCSMPLQYMWREVDEETGRPFVVRGEREVEVESERLAQCEAEILRCVATIGELEGKSTAK